MSTARAPVVRLARVAHRYAGAAALDGVDLAIERGRLVAFVGPDGVGKSTLLGLIAGARRIQEGSVEVLGGDMRQARHRREACRRLAYMPQGLGRNLYPTLSIAENLDFFARLFGQPREERAARIAGLLEATGLAPFAARPVAQLSGGMKQKLGLCCALVHDPDLLVLDEPSTGVDPLSRRRFWTLMARLRARRPQMTVLISTAYFEEAEAFDEVVVMDAGRVLAHGTPAAIRAASGAASLEAAFVALLPEARRRGYGVRAAARTAPAGEVAIEAAGLTHRFGDFVAVDRATFRIHRGEIFGFIGPNGCGKTTTMKMLTGLLAATEGEALLFGKPVHARDLDTRRRVGFMSQSFSLYTELTVLQNLKLHARLFHLPRERAAARIDDLVERFGLGGHLHQAAESVPLGVRQRLSLAVAVIHDPEVLILDEPTSGVDPVARDRFWALLTSLARDQGVTIFVSTHFMNEAERCDRVALMHEGRVLAEGQAHRIAREAGAASLEEAFVALIAAASPEPAGAPLPPAGRAASSRPGRRFSLARLAALARRETLELTRDPVQLAFALLGPIAILVVFALGVTWDLENVAYSAFDQDRSAESRAYLENFSASRYFEEHAPSADAGDLERRLRSGELRFALEIPAGFGRSLRQGRSPEVLAHIDGAFPFRGQSTRAYVEGAHLAYVRNLAREEGVALAPAPAEVEVRLRYNQAFRSVYAVVPSAIMLILMLIPAVAAAVGIVREKELGSITNLYVTPTTGLEFLLGKQLPYFAVSMIDFAVLAAIAVAVFGVPVKGSVAALTAGAALYVGAATAFGLLVSSFVRTQIAAIFATAIIASVPTVQYSGFMLPVSSMSPDAQWIAHLFPAMYFQHVSVGAFTKGLGFGALASDFAALALMLVALLAAARAMLKTQEA